MIEKKNLLSGLQIFDHLNNTIIISKELEKKTINDLNFNMNIQLPSNIFLKLMTIELQKSEQLNEIIVSYLFISF